MIDEPNLAGIDVLKFIDQKVIISARDRAAIGLVFSHRLDDKWNHVGEIYGVGVSQRLLVDVKILDGFIEHFIVAIDGGRESIRVQQALLRPANDVQDVFLFIPPHPARTEDESLFRGVPKLEPLGESVDLRISFEEPKREGMKRHNLKFYGRRQFQQPCQAAAHLVGCLLGERDSENAFRSDALPDQIHETAGQGARLTRARPCEGQLNCTLSPGGGRLGGVKTPHRPLCPTLWKRLLWYGRWSSPA